MGLGMGLSLAPRLKLTLALKCTVCQQNIHNDEEERQMLELFGAEKYGWCICCKRIMPPDIWDHGYKCRWTRYFNRTKQQAATQQKSSS